ncbi:glycoside hydrolase family 5 protein [Butyrivibrio sp. VCB2006]|uniref:glycoside hydrolase family 5 protein n=1 Tax=Butyrivibrio sp. VCB2006 TaxID=1280679 RepID=UPI000687D1B6|nr:glycoside hydrolase family 5 protein [Butyrivibrio sp. VCB2006]
MDAHYGEPNGTANLGQETIWGQPKTTQQIIDFVRAQGFNTIRIPVSWYYHTYTGSDGALHVHPDWMARVKEVVNYCLNDNMYVIMDSHHDGKIFHAGVGANELATIKANTVSVWTDIATFFNDCDTRLMFEAFNEPDNYEKYWQFGKKAASQMNELNQLFVNTVRSTGGNNAERCLVVPTLLDGTGDNFLNAFVLPKDRVKDRLLVTVHSYPQSFDQSIDGIFANLQSFSKRVGAPVVIGEWGTKTSFSPATYRSVHAANFVARANAYGIKCIYWDNGSDYAIIDRVNLTANQDMIHAIMNPAPYTSDSAGVVTDWSNYLYMTIDQNTGALKEDKHWGTIILNIDGNGLVPIPAGATAISLQLSRSGDMSTQAFHYVYFFDSNNVLLDKINDWNGFVDKSVAIPSGATSVRIGINSAQTATSKKQYSDAVKNGTLTPVIKFY